MTVAPSQKRRTVVVAIAALTVVLVLVWRRPTETASTHGTAAAAARAPGHEGDDAPVAARLARRLTRGVFDESLGMVRIEGTVVDGRDKRPVAGAEVAFTGSGQGEFTTITGPDGRYHLEVMPGPWTVRATADSRLSVPQRVAVSRDNGRIDLELVTLGRVRGIVRTADGRPVGGAEVSIETSDRGVSDALDATVGRTAISGGDGRYELAALPGEVRLQASAGPLSGAGSTPALAAGAEAVVDITLRPRLRVAGRVVDAAGRPVGGATVICLPQFFDHGGRNRRTTSTDASGRFEFQNVEASTVILDAHTDAGAAAPVTRLELATVTKLDELELRLADGARVTGRVLDADGAPVDGARVTLTRHGTSWPFAITDTDRTGRFDLPVPPGDHFQVVAALDDRVARVPDAASGAELSLVVNAKGGLRGHVHRGGAPVDTDLTVTVVRFVPAGGEAPWPRFTVLHTTSRAGRFAIDSLEAGHYDLVVEPAGQPPRTLAGVLVPPNDVAALDVPLDAAPRP